MIVLKTIAELNQFNKVTRQNKVLGFVPTMGALHQGHLSLIKQSKLNTDLTLCSIFVNPTQFNNQTDFEKYPITLETDLELLKAVECNAVFIPSVDEMYPKTETLNHYNFGFLETVMEGMHRPGHFNGVGLILDKLFTLINPNKAFFGEKDFQQLKIVESLVKQNKFDIEIIGCPILREIDGLAMSSRNMRLTPDQRTEATFLYKTLKEAAVRSKNLNPYELKLWIENEFIQKTNFKLDYVEIANETDLMPIKNWDLNLKPRIFIATFLGDVRLIDNLPLNN